MLQVMMMFLLYICLAKAENLPEASRQEVLSEKVYHHNAVLPKKKSQFNNQIAREGATGQHQQKKQEGIEEVLLNQPKNAPKNALADSKLSESYKENGPPLPLLEGKEKASELTKAEHLARTELPESSFERGATPPTMEPLNGGGPPEPWEMK